MSVSALERQRIADAFDGAHDYDAHAAVQRRVAAGLAQRIVALPLPAAPRVLEFGCGTGFLAAAAADGLANVDWLMTDIAPAMIERSRLRFAGDARFRFALLDAEQPSLPQGSFDVVCSSLALQWLQEPEHALQKLWRLLRSDGVLLFTTLIAGTFEEWRRAHLDVGLAPGTLPFLSEDRLSSIVPGGASAEVSVETIVEPYTSAADFLHALRAIGAHTPGAGHRPLSPGAMRAVMHRFERSGAHVTYRVATYCFRRTTAPAG